jgi:hypothetical protein
MKLLEILRWPFRRSRNSKKPKKRPVYAYRDVTDLKVSPSSRIRRKKSLSGVSVVSWPLPNTHVGPDGPDVHGAQSRYHNALERDGSDDDSPYDAAAHTGGSWSAELTRRRNSSPADYPVTPPRTTRKVFDGQLSPGRISSTSYSGETRLVLNELPLTGDTQGTLGK